MKWDVDLFTLTYISEERAKEWYKNDDIRNNMTRREENLLLNLIFARQVIRDLEYDIKEGYLP